MTKAHYDLLVVMTQPPLIGAQSKEALDTALVSATFDRKTALAFVGEGVLQLLPDQQPDRVDSKGIQAMLKALPLYDLDAVFVQQTSLESRKLKADELLLEAEPLSDTALADLIASSNNHLVF
ncbi:sulfurtransferase complex subunit TusC [Marinospirillum perlucidum]|uniref:sulfurtransferase complex subunit TusC n=1 Tax=Marinospirillum perlucidum TaxID=1982602 RepID=UPI000DF1FA5C|nr:sulfurtransferase complex subunit TusC [Marinospirillum perlucidum]